MRRETGLGDGLRGYFEGVQTALGKAGPSVPERHRGFGESNQRERGGMDLASAEVETAGTHGGGGRRNVHRAVCVSGRGVNQLGKLRIAPVAGSLGIAFR